jgi:5,10-methylenetetrahydromethanopterin reductase
MTEPASGVVLQGVDPPGEFCDRVAEIESLGFGYLWLTDSSLHARNCYSYLTLAAARSSRLRLGTAVTNPVTRHPAITAAAAATVDEIARWRPWRRRSPGSGGCGRGRSWTSRRRASP